MISHKYKFIIILLPKNASTSLIKLFNDSQEQLIDYRVRNNTQKHYDKLGDGELNYFKIATCRNSFSRVVSLWKFWNKVFHRKKTNCKIFILCKNYTEIQKKYVVLVTNMKKYIFVLVLMVLLYLRIIVYLTTT